MTRSASDFPLVVFAGKLADFVGEFHPRLFPPPGTSGGVGVKALGIANSLAARGHHIPHHFRDIARISELWEEPLHARGISGDSGEIHPAERTRDGGPVSDVVAERAVHGFDVGDS